MKKDYGWLVLYIIPLAASYAGFELFRTLVENGEKFFIALLLFLIMLIGYALGSRYGK